jgi:hypothetical protein
MKITIPACGLRSLPVSAMPPTDDARQHTHELGGAFGLGMMCTAAPTMAIWGRASTASDQPRSNENETIRSGQHDIGACVTTEKQGPRAEFVYCEVN